MTINPIKIIRNRRVKNEQRIRLETIDFLSKNGMLKSSVS